MILATNQGVYRREVMRDRPILYAPLWELSGSQATDQSGGGTPGIYNGSIILGGQGSVAGDSSKSPVFDGSTTNVNFGSPSFLNFSAGDYTLESWINPEALGPAIRSIIFGKDETTGRQFTFSINEQVSSAGSGSLAMGLFSGTLTIYSAPNILVAGFWFHIVGLRRGNSFEIWINGISQTLTLFLGSPLPQTMNSTTTAMQLGARTYPANFDNFTGQIANAAIYNYAISPGRITSHYRAGKGLMPVTRTLWAPKPASGLLLRGALQSGGRMSGLGSGIYSGGRN